MRTSLVAASALVVAMTLAACAPVSTPPVSRAVDIEDVPSGTVRPSAEPVPLSEDVRPLDVSYEHGGQRRTLDDFLRRSKAKGFVVLDGRRVVAERYVGASRDTRFQTWSVAKSFTATAVGIAVGQGAIKSIDDPVTRYLPELNGSGYRGVSIRDLLRMSSGVDWNEPRDVFRVQAEALRGTGLARIAARQVNAWPPGSRFNYDSLNYFVLAWVISRATGMPYQRYVQEHLWQPAGMADGADIGNDGRGHGLGYCCYYATDRDLARFGLLYLRGGRAGDTQVVPESWVRESTRPSSSHTPGYGLGWWLGGAEGDFLAAGFGGQYIYVSPRHGVVIVQSAEGNGRGANHLQAEALTAFRTVAATVTVSAGHGS